MNYTHRLKESAGKKFAGRRVRILYRGQYPQYPLKSRLAHVVDEQERSFFCTEDELEELHTSHHDVPKTN